MTVGCSQRCWMDGGGLGETCGDGKTGLCTYIYIYILYIYYIIYIYTIFFVYIYIIHYIFHIIYIYYYIIYIIIIYIDWCINIYIYIQCNIRTCISENPRSNQVAGLSDRSMYRIPDPTNRRNLVDLDFVGVSQN